MNAYVLQVNGEVVAVTDTLSGAMGMAACYYGAHSIEYVTARCWCDKERRVKITELPYTSIGVSPSQRVDL